MIDDYPINIRHVPRGSRPPVIVLNEGTFGKLSLVPASVRSGRMERGELSAVITR